MNMQCSEPIHQTGLEALWVAVDLGCTEWTMACGLLTDWVGHTEQRWMVRQRYVLLFTSQRLVELMIRTRQI